MHCKIMGMVVNNIPPELNAMLKLPRFQEININDSNNKNKINNNNNYAHGVNMCVKVKPYNVVDLSTHQILTEEEICECLRDAVKKEMMKKAGVYYGYKNRAKKNGDAPNFVNPPPKRKSKSVGSLLTAWEQDEKYCSDEEEEDLGYDDLPYKRERANTAPPTCLLVRCDSLSALSGKPFSKASRLTSPASPGSTKRKVQQKLQRDGKSQIAGPRMPLNKGSPSPLTKHYSGSRIPATKSSLPTVTPTIEPSQNNEQKGSMIASRKSDQRNHTPPDTKGKPNRIAQSNFRSNLSRLSNKNSDAGSECSSDSGSCRSTPSYGSQSPLDSLKKAVSPPINSVIPEDNQNADVVSSKGKTVPVFEKKYSSETLPIRRERTFDNVNQRKSSSPKISPRRKGSIEDISNAQKKALSSSSIPSTRLKQSSESLPASLDDNPLLKQRYESSSSIASSSRRSSIESTASDSSDVSRLSKPERYSKLPSADQKKTTNTRVPGIPSVSKKPAAVIGSPKSKLKQPGTGAKPSNSSSRMRQPTPAIKKTDITATTVSIEEAEKFNTLPAKLPSATKLNIQKPSIRPPGSTLLVEDTKKKKMESPLTHRNKLTYVNSKPEKIANSKSEQNVNSKLEQNTNSKPEQNSNSKPEQNQQKDINSEPSKLRLPGGISKSSPATQRTTKYSHPQGLRPTSNPLGISKMSNTSKLQTSFGFTPCPISNTDGNAENILDEAGFKEETIVEKEEKDKINENESIVEKPKNVEDLVTKHSPAEDIKTSKKFNGMHIFVDDHDLRDMESINSSRSSELDDGYSSLHKLDNLSPTLAEELSKANTDGDTDTSRSDVDNKQGAIEVSLFMHDDDVTKMTSLKNKPEEVNFDEVFRSSTDESCYGYADPEDSIQVDMSGYEVPKDSKVSDDDDDDVDDDDNKRCVGDLSRDLSRDLSLKFQHTYSICDYSPVKLDAGDVTPQDENDPFTKAFQNAPSTMGAPSVSPFKRIHPKVLVPPPLLNSICKNGELAPVPAEYMRTPSSDGDEILLSKFYAGDLRRRAREQAKKVWTAKTSRDDDFDELTGCPEEVKGSERMEDDIFYSSKELNKVSSEFPMKSPRMSTHTSTRTSARTSFDTPPVGTNDTTHRHESTSSEQEKKKKSKLKKFFKKLSTTNKKECKVDFDLPSIGDNSRAGNDNRFPNDGYSNLQYRRGSEGGDSCHSNQDIHAINSTSSSTLPLSKRRMFTFNLSFMKKGRRGRSSTEQSVFTDDSVCDPHDVLSNTVRALCSPELPRRSDRIPVRFSRRGSDPSLYHSQNRPVSPSKKKYRAPDPPNILLYSDTEFEHKRNISSSSTFSGDDVEYANYPFSKVNIKAPTKPLRLPKGGYGDQCSADRCSVNSSCNQDDRTDYPETTRASKNEPVNEQRCSGGSQSSSSSLLSSDYTYSSHKPPMPYDSASTRSTGSLRRTPLRHSVDSYSKLLEVHKQTIEKIASEISTLRCDCETLHNLEWDDFERTDEMIQLGLNSYMVVPVACGSKVSYKRTFYAWLRLSQQHAATESSNYPNFNISKSTLHRNCIHACHVMQQDYSAPFQEGIPKSIQIDCVYISTQCPKMTLSRYISLTLEKHARYSEIYEREAAMMLLQVVKGIQNLYANNARISSIESDNIFILNNGEPSVVLSPRREPNRCPSLAVAALPGLGNCFQKTETDAVTNICHQLAFLLFQLLHSPYQDELNDAVDMSMLLATLPDITIKSIYSRYLQYVINLLLGTSSHTTKSLEDLQVILEIILFGPSDISEHSEEETMILINKWHNRRCVDMVTHILKEAPLIMLCASGPSAQDIEKIKNVDQEILLECEFLSYISAADIYRVSKMLNR